MSLQEGFPRALGACAIGWALAAPGAQAHVVLQQKTAEAGSSYRAVLQVGHGCNGSPTTAITVVLPPGVQGAKAMPKAGWTLQQVREPLAAPSTSHGRTMTEDVRRIRWQGGPLADAEYDEFVVRLTLPEQPGPLWFEVLQECEGGRTDWTERPAQGTSTRGLKAPAALLDVQPAAPAPAAHAH